MTSAKGGPRAFPANQHVSFYDCRFEDFKEKERETLVKLVDDPGMSLRDYFAAKALQGLLADTAYGEGHEMTAKMCYAYADAMLEARDARQSF